MSRLFEPNKQVSALLITELNVKFIYHAACYIQHEQITLNDLNNIWKLLCFPKNVFKTCPQKLLLKLYAS